MKESSNVELSWLFFFNTCHTVNISSLFFPLWLLEARRGYMSCLKCHTYSHRINVVSKEQESGSSWTLCGAINPLYLVERAHRGIISLIALYFLVKVYSIYLHKHSEVMALSQIYVPRGEAFSTLCQEEACFMGTSTWNTKSEVFDHLYSQ